jgi:hypothetical protein
VEGFGPQAAEFETRKARKEETMSVRFLITSAALLAIAGPAFADCNQEIERLSEAVTQAETGASTDAAMPTTPHQEEVLAGDQQSESEEAGGATSAGQANVPASPHQQQALTETEGGDQQPAGILAEARDLAEAGDEAGCMEKVTQVKDLLGTE